MIKTYEDYVDKMCELFPEIQKEDIYNIIKYGSKKMFMYISEGHDFTIDYKWPRSSILISNNNDTGMTKIKEIKLKRKERWINTERNKLQLKNDQ